ncbi:MAG: DUF423 domain-containing protein [Pseudomonadota bacterium]|nr:DUF423 domain-containing protein [Pseudomonadota bacterium]
MKNPQSSKFVVLGSVFAALGIVAGAFAAHALKAILDPAALTVFETAVRYQMYHAFGILFVAWACEQLPTANLQQVGNLFCAGILLFSGSLYGVSLFEINKLGMITPLGGLAFILGWLLLGLRFSKVDGKRLGI